MAGETTGPINGIIWGWNLGDSTYKPGMDANLKLLDLLSRASILDRNLTAPPGSPAEGDCYIPVATATGDWAGHEDDIAVYLGATWVFYTPKQGWLFYIEDEAVISVYKTATGWSTGVSI